jgi:hypothetical protein
MHAVQVSPIALDIRPEWPSDVRTFIVKQTGGCKCPVYDIDSTVDNSFVVGVLNPYNKFPARLVGDQILVDSRAKIPDVHKSGRTGRKTGANFLGFIVDIICH